MNLPNMKKPCSECPFRKDSLKGWLGENRMKEILSQDSFVCHKTVDCALENEDDKKRKQCAGFMLINNKKSLFVRLAKIMGIELKIEGRELIFGNEKECVKHHSFKEKATAEKLKE